MEDLILIAKIRRPHGIKGEVILESFTNDNKRFKKLKRVFLKNAKGEISEATLETFRDTANGPLIRLKEFPDRNAVEVLRNYEILIPESERPAMPEGHAYYDQIIGMDVVDEESGEKIGVVADIFELPAGDVLSITLNDGSEKLVTSAGEEVRAIDVKSNTLKIKLLEEL